MKKIIAVFWCVAFTLSLTVVAFAYNPEEFSNNYGGKDVTEDVFVMVDAPVYMLDNCKLIVNGKKISEHIEDVRIYYDGYKGGSHNVQAQIPFIAVVKALGAKVLWLGDNNALILYRGILFYLNIKKQLLLTSHPAGIILINVFYPMWAAGGVYVGEYTQLKRECMINSEYSFQFFSAICKIHRQIDLETATITITSN